MCFKLQERNICRLEMSNISKEAKILMQKYLRLGHLLSDIWKTTIIRRKREEGIQLAAIDEFVVIPAQIEKFWPVSTNKENLHLYTRKLVQMIDNLILSNMVENNEIVNSLHKNGEKIKTIEELST